MGSELDWDDGAPRSRRFGDIYYNPADGLAETRHTFLAGCGLPDAWEGRELFVIGETGFGTGLNFLAAAAAFAQTAGPDQRLHYVAVEGYPLEPADLRRAHQAFPELAPVSTDLLTVYPRSPASGFQRLHLAGRRIILDLLVGEVATMLSQLEARVDAWFLDGFAPSKNPEMWRPEVLEQLARLAAPQAALATFTAAGAVRRGLQAVGFDVARTPGFGHKRERIVARYAGSEQPEALPAWARVRPVTRPLCIHGSGIAGVSAARALQRRGLAFGWARGEQPRASDVPTALVMPRLAVDDNPRSRFFAQAFDHAVREYSGTEAWIPGGALQLAADDQEVQRMERIAARWSAAEFVDAAGGQERVGVSVQQPGLWLGEAGLVRTDAWLALRHESPGLPDEDALAIRATGIGMAEQHLGTALPLTAWRGQITRVAASPHSAQLEANLVSGHFLSAAVDGKHMLGATFDRVAADELAVDVRDEDHDRNLAAVAEWTEVLWSERPAIVEGWAGIRAALPDRFPAAGLLPELDTFLEAHGYLRHRPKKTVGPTLDAQDAVLTGFGARGYTAAPLAAELVISQLLGEPWPVPIDVALALHPARFMVRDLRKGRR